MIENIPKKVTFNTLKNDYICDEMEVPTDLSFHIVTYTNEQKQ